MHSVVLVKLKNLDDLDDVMAPYDENREEEAYIVETKQQVIDRTREEANEKLKTYADYYKDPEAYKAANPNSSKLVQTLEECKYEDIVKMTDEEIYNKVVKALYDESEFDKDGNIISTYNPDSHWDWWVVGGRWSGWLKSKKREDGDGYISNTEDGSCDFCKFSDIDIEAMMAVSPYDLARAEAMWETAVNGAPMPEEFKEDNCFIYKKEYLLRRYGTKEKYLEHMHNICFSAVVDEEGWHTAGYSKLSYDDPDYMNDCNRIEREWDDRFMEDYFLNGDPDEYYVVVDCHI